MEQRDYLKDQIDEMAKVLGAILSKILGLSKNTDFVALEKKASNELEVQLNMELKKLVNESLSDFDSHIHSSFSNHPDLYKPLAEIFELIGDKAQEEERDKEALAYYHRALELLEFVNQEGDAFSLELNADIQDLVLKIQTIG